MRCANQGDLADFGSNDGGDGEDDGDREDDSDSEDDGEE